MASGHWDDGGGGAAVRRQICRRGTRLQRRFGWNNQRCNRRSHLPYRHQEVCARRTVGSCHLHSPWLQHVLCGNPVRAGSGAEILSEVEASLRSLYSTRHKSRERSGIIDYTVWSDVFTCDNCSQHIVLWDAVMDPETRRRKSRHEVCSVRTVNTIGDVRKMSRAMETYHDTGTGDIAKRVTQVPILIQYRQGSHRSKKLRMRAILQLLASVTSCCGLWTCLTQCLEMPDGLRKAKDAYHLRGITHTHHFFTSRNLIAFARLWNACFGLQGTIGHQLRFWLTSVALGFTKLNRYFESSSRKSIDT